MTTDIVNQLSYYLSSRFHKAVVSNFIFLVSGFEYNVRLEIKNGNYS
jgi:hypothetical protein